MRLKRLAGMGVSEAAFRGRQEASKWLDRMAEPSYHPTPLATPPRFGRFFAGAGSETARCVSQRMPRARQALVDAAETLRQGRFDLLGYRGLWFGEPIDWQLDPLAGKRAPLVHWSGIEPLASEQVGDAKVTWELNRHQWAVTLGQAYRLTGDEAYASYFALRVHAWLAANPPGFGINWASSLEAAFRIVAWSWALALFEGAPALDARLRDAMVRGLESHALHVEKYLSLYFSPNTHLTGEALGLVYAGVLFPDLPRARAFRDTGLRVLEEQLSRQVLDDGVYFERATGYQRYTVEIYLHLVILAREAGLTISDQVGARLQDLLDALVLLGPDGRMPAIGDADGGWLLPLAARAPDDLRGILSTAAVVFSRPDYAWAAGGAAPETAWLLGASGLAAFDALAPAAPGGNPSRLLPDGGYAIQASSWEPEAHRLVFDVGPLGCPVSGGHGHADLLSLQCRVFGDAMLVDPGTGVYTSAAGWRQYFRGSASHSTVLVDGVGQAEPAGPFAWKARPQARLRAWRSTPRFDLADADHDAYARLRDPVIHRRRILFMKPRYWLVADDLYGAFEHRVEVRFQFAPVPVEQEGEWLRGRGAHGGLLLRAFASVPLQIDRHHGEAEPLAGWVSPDYGVFEPATLVAFVATTRLPVRILSLLLPIADVEAPPPDVRVVESDESGPLALAFEATGERLSFSDLEAS